jgi:protein CWC15
VDDVLAAFDDADDDVLDRDRASGVGAAASSSSAAAAAAAWESSSDEGSDEDDMDELMRELERLKREREEERQRKEREAAELAEKEHTEAALRGNPLMPGPGAGAAAAGGHASIHGTGNAAVKRRFGDDTVFSHTHASEPEAKKRFINDVIRSDFHRRFLKQFVQ